MAALSRLLMSDDDINLNRAVLMPPVLKTNLPQDDLRCGLERRMTLLPNQTAVATMHKHSTLPADPKEKAPGHDLVSVRQHTDLRTKAGYRVEFVQPWKCR